MKVELKDVRSMILGHAVGDALGVPVEFTRRELLAKNPVKGMREFCSHNQPKGTWSDDTSTALCFMDAVVQNNGGIVLQDIMQNFVKWVRNADFTAGGKVFDVGNTTYEAILNYSKYGCTPLNSGLDDFNSNGNGSLMRIAPTALYICAGKADLRMADVISSLTHAHEISKAGCRIYCAIVEGLFKGQDKSKAVENAIRVTNAPKEYHRLFDVASFCSLENKEISSSGYVVDSLEAALWCFLTTNSYKNCLLKAVNLGRDTDTIGAIVGGIAGLYYREDSIPKEWLRVLKRRSYIKGLCEKFYNVLQ